MNIRSAFRPVVLGSLLALFAVACGGAGEDVGAASASAAGITKQGHRGFDPARTLARFDRNADGRVELAELPERMQARMGGADANRDGVLALDEVTAHMQAQRAQRFARLDANHDGAVTADEVGERWAHVGRADANTDGRVTADELTQARATGALRGGPMGHGGPEGHRGFDPARMMVRFDRNADGRVEVAELPERMQARLGAADVNHDGVLAVDEVTAFHAQRRAERARELPGAPAAPAAQ